MDYATILERIASALQQLADQAKRQNDIEEEENKRIYAAHIQGQFFHRPNKTEED